MKRFLLITLAAVCCAGTVRAQAGEIAVFSDAAGTSCEFVAAGYVQIHFFHINTDCAIGSQWKLEHPPTWSFYAFLDTWGWYSGSPDTGITVNYGCCPSGSFWIGTADYAASGDPANTCIRIVPDPSSVTGQIEGWDCSQNTNTIFPTGGFGLVNPDGTVDCATGCGPVPVDYATWGQIKALYD